MVKLSRGNGIPWEEDSPQLGLNEELRVKSLWRGVEGSSRDAWVNMVSSRYRVTVAKTYTSVRAIEINLVVRTMQAKRQPQQP